MKIIIDIYVHFFIYYTFTGNINNIIKKNILF